MRHLNAALDWLGERVTLAVGTMWCALAFVVVAIVATPGIFPQPVTAAAQWFAQDFLQLVLLPVIMVGGAVEARKAENRATEMYDWLSELHTAMHTAHGKLDALAAAPEEDDR